MIWSSFAFNPQVHTKFCITGKKNNYHYIHTVIVTYRPPLTIQQSLLQCTPQGRLIWHLKQHSSTSPPFALVLSSSTILVVFFKGAVDQILIYDVFMEKRRGEFISYLSWCDLCHRWGYRPFLLKLGIWFRNANCQHSGNSLWY